MRKRRVTINYIIYLLLVLLPIYSDSPLSKYLGAGGYSLLTTLSPVLFLMYLLKKSGRVKLDSVERRLLYMMLWVMIAGIIGTSIWVLLGNSLETLGENLIIKDIKVFILVISYPIYLFLFRNHSEKLSERELFIPIEIALWFMAIFCILESQQLPYAFENIHYAGTFPYYRIRLLTMESSCTAPIIFDYAVLSLFFSMRNKKYAHSFLNIISVLILIAFTTSKTLLVYVLVATAIVYFFNIKNLSRKAIVKSFIIIILFIGLGLILLPKLIHSLQGDIANFTSSATRGYTLLIAALIGNFFPLGLGGSFIGFFANYLREYMYLFNLINIPLNTSEIVGIYSSGNDGGLTTSAGFFVFHMYWGIIVSVFWMKMLYKILTRIKSSNMSCSSLLYAGFLTNTILSFIYVAYNFEFWMLFAMTLLLCRRYGNVKE